ncbi:transposase [Brevibacillus borstelensis]
MKHKMKLQEKVKTLFATIEETEKQEERENSGQDLSELGEASKITSEKLETVVKQLEENCMRNQRISRLKKRFASSAKTCFQGFKSTRCSKKFSETATVTARPIRKPPLCSMNGQLKPGYNVQIGTENQFIVGYSLHQRPTDTRCLKPHLEQVKANLGKLPKTIIADAGYSGEENYAYLENEKLEALVKYSTYHKEKSKAWLKDISKIDNWQYDEVADTWTCAAGQTLIFCRESKEKTESGFEIRYRHYRSTSCEGCPLKPSCTKAAGDREVKVSLRYLRFKQQVREKFRSEEGYALSVRRMIEPESVFGQMKNNRGFRRFLLRCIPKVSLEVGWFSLAHNLLRKSVMDQKRKVVGQE